MEQKILTDKIIGFCFDHGVLDKSEDVSTIKIMVEKGLEKEEFIENLINTIIHKTRSHPHVDVKQVIEILIELEKIRLELEYSRRNLVS